MLKPDDAQQQIAACIVGDAVELRLKRLAALPESVRSVGYTLLARDESGNPDEKLRKNGRYQYTYQFEVHKAVHDLDRRPKPERTALFAALFPRLTAHLDAAWELLMQRPFFTFGERQSSPFRAADQPQLSREARRDLIITLVDAMEMFDPDIVWLATWAPYLRCSSHPTAAVAYRVGWLLAAAIDSKHAESPIVFDILAASATNAHPVGAMGRHVVTGLLNASRPDGWELIEQILLTAQRDEGVRTMILETVDQAHPEAFRRMLQLIAGNNLCRFTSILRTASIWLGFPVDVFEPKQIEDATADLARFMSDEPARKHAIRVGTGQTLYLALFADGFCDAAMLQHAALALLADPEPERRFIGLFMIGKIRLLVNAPEISPVESMTRNVHNTISTVSKAVVSTGIAAKASSFFARIGIGQSSTTSTPGEITQPPPARLRQYTLLNAVEDSDLRIAAYAYGMLGSQRVPKEYDWRPICDRFIARLPNKPADLGPLVWPWVTIPVDVSAAKARVATLIGQDDPTKLIPYLKDMHPWNREAAARKFAEMETWNSEVRGAMLSLTGDSSQSVRDKVFPAIAKKKIITGEAADFERLLSRKTADIRTGSICALLTLSDTDLLASTARLLADTDTLKRQAALDILTQMINENRCAETCIAMAAQYGTNSHLPETETRLLARIVVSPGHAETIVEPVRLYRNEELTPIPEISLPPAALLTPASVQCILSLHALIESHRETMITIEGHDGVPYQKLLGEAFGMHSYDYRRKPIDPDTIPLQELWMNWYHNRPPAMRDTDGLEIFRSLAGFALSETSGINSGSDEQKRIKSVVHKAGAWPQKEWKYAFQLDDILQWLVCHVAATASIDLALDGHEAKLYVWANRETLLSDVVEPRYAWTWQMAWDNIARLLWHFRLEIWSEPQIARYWKLLRFEGWPISCRYFAPTESVAAFGFGAATEADVIATLLESDWLSQAVPEHVAKRYPYVVPIVRRISDQVVDIEVQRGDMPSIATEHAKRLHHAGGCDALFRLLKAMGGSSCVRAGAERSRTLVLSHLIQVTSPDPGDSSELFSTLSAESKMTTKQLLELAMYAPQWSGHVESLLEWPGLASAIGWVCTHVKYVGYSQQSAAANTWERKAAERTPLSLEDLAQGAVDVEWLLEVYGELGEERWKQVYVASHFASGTGGQKRAQLYADAILGKAGTEDLLKRIKDKRNQDNLKAYGLAPLAIGDMTKSDLLARYEVIQEFLRSSKQFGAQRRESESIAVRIAMENLARTAGFGDPMRLEWAMEAASVSDLAAGPVVAACGDVQVSLTISDFGKPEVTVQKAGKILATVPAAAKKDEAITALLARSKSIEKQAARMRESLQESMCRGERFRVDDIRSMLNHPVLAPMVRSLVFVSDSASGYPVDDGAALQSWDGSVKAIAEEDELLIAHPWYLLQSGSLPEWHRDCFMRERIQPFKQVFRELYVLTDAEIESNVYSNRYAGHQLNPRKATGILKSRGWIFEHEEGIRRTYHRDRVTAWIVADLGYGTVADIEGPSVDQIYFTKSGSYKPMPLNTVPPRLFSETMRDIDLLVSVAHAGGVDPEASASTTEMRARLVEEAARLLKLNNVRLNGVHVMVDGTLGTYSIHLGSAVVHRQPGGHLCIVAVPGQHRGRLFLPFADDDPRTAEVVSKVILLAKDEEIKDPVILEQILPRS